MREEETFSAEAPPLVVSKDEIEPYNTVTKSTLNPLTEPMNSSFIVFVNINETILKKEGT